MVVGAVELVIAALSAGAAAGVSSTASAAVTDAYEGLKALVRQAVQKGTSQTNELDAQSESVINEQLVAPEQHRDALAAALNAAGAGQDAELIEVARRVLELVDTGDSRAHTFVVDVHDNQGVQTGDYNTMTLNINSK